MNRSRAVALAAMIAAPSLFFAQTPPTAKNPLHIQANLIYVPVTVTDSQGVPVVNLCQQDFQLTEDGQPQTIRYFEQQASRPLSVVLAIDNSLSVRKNIPEEKQAASDFARAILQQRNRLALIEFSGQVRQHVPFTNNAARIEHGIKHLRGDGLTALYDAIVQAAQALEKQPGRRIIVVISDGANSVPGADYNQARMAALRVEASIESVIMVPIAANAGRNLGGEHALIQLSSDTGGRYFYVQRKGELQAALALLVHSLHQEYLLGYYAPSAQSDPQAEEGDYRHIHVEITPAAANAQLHGNYRRGYFLGSEQ